MDFRNKSTRELSELMRSIKTELEKRGKDRENVCRVFSKALQEEQFEKANELLKEYPRMHYGFVYRDLHWSILWATSTKPLEFLLEKIDKKYISRGLERKDGGVWSTFILAYSGVIEDPHLDEDYAKKWLECVEEKLDLLAPYRYTFNMFLKSDENKNTIEHHKDLVSKIKTRYNLE